MIKNVFELSPAKINLDLENTTSEKTFHFSDENDFSTLSWSSNSSNFSESDLHVCGEKCLNVKVMEVLHPSYSMYVWPCSPVLAQYIWNNRSLLKGKTVLELGAGTALPSVVAAKCGAYVIWSDKENLSETLKYGKYNLELNNISPENYEAMQISWGTFSPSLICMKAIDVILGSDVFYEFEDFEDVIVTVAVLMQKNINAEFWCSYQERSMDYNIESLLWKWSLSCEEIFLPNFGADGPNVASWNIPKNYKIQLFVFRHKDSKLSFLKT